MYSLCMPAEIKHAGAVKYIPASTIAKAKFRPTAFQQIFGWLKSSRKGRRNCDLLAVIGKK